MAHFASLVGRGVGLVEIFLNPHGREWYELQRYADPIDGLRGYLIDGDLYLWGSLPLHRDVHPLLREVIHLPEGTWFGIQVNRRLARCVVSEVVDRHGQPVDMPSAEAVLRRSKPLTSLLGEGFTIARMASQLVPDFEVDGCLPADG